MCANIDRLEDGEHEWAQLGARIKRSVHNLYHFDNNTFSNCYLHFTIGLCRQGFVHWILLLSFKVTQYGCYWCDIVEIRWVLSHCCDKASRICSEYFSYLKLSLDCWEIQFHGTHPPLLASWQCNSCWKSKRYKLITDRSATPTHDQSNLPYKRAPHLKANTGALLISSTRALLA